MRSCYFKRKGPESDVIRDHLVQAQGATLAAPVLAITGFRGEGLGEVFVHKNVTTFLQCECDPGAWQEHGHADPLHTELTP